MPIGVIVNALSVAAGGVIGALFGHKLPAKINSELTKIFGVCSMGMGVSSIGLMKNMPAVIFAVIIGTALKSAIISGVVSGKINFAAANIIRKITHCGIATAATTIPNVPPKIIAVKKSRIDFEIKIV